ncbi:hypothetical protein A2763_02090 [Candidatus Kaiserbacteria bacterium RIFCSPHIGHO2_01_FULL_54_36]|uniref:GtrA/DPMS transmembrane domain-containing protein n=1 Tax=Candidatus Kaiserbacteria bacterium RIFCSPHIGHO2_01_FULL_54_36 TaxID=1798482 RepID=A0A1F6CPI9_9BACT|nr:MAG: hypothetical protein A2763_02090 [Candidatus Kaiserbacteria bacterium RIFCSPHIGHO2_01_FULL_54_36]OGG75899.1 MAG: hypothetical protein A3A41_04560 [Candidatus Kaiserbacteria bacterium RIFCSPLOWO2_01_FULL_54_22]
MQKIIRFVIAGLIATMTNLFVTYALTDTFGIWYLYSSIGGFCAGFSVSFTLQKFWTFRHTALERMHVEAAQYFLVALGGLLFDAGAVYTLVEYAGSHYLFAQFVVGIFIAIANFIFYHMIFRGAPRRPFKTLWSEELGEWERGLIIAGGVSLLLVAVKFFGIDLPFHQDEWKTARFVVDPVGMAGLFHHPPLTELLYRIAGFLPPELLRLIPLAFTAGSFGLLYLIVERRAGFKAALLTIIVLGTSAYGTIAALMLDLDGAILPFFMLLSVYAYDRAREYSGGLRVLFLSLLLVALILGFLIKLSFVIVVGALMLDYLYERRRDITWGLVARLGSALLVFLAVLAFLVWVARYVYPAFSADAMIGHALTYVQGFDRGWGQIIFQTVKALLYTGPIALAAVVFFSREVFERTRIFNIYLGAGLIFYLMLFDFSMGALDKYLMFSIVPVCAIAAVALAPHLRMFSRSQAALLLASATALFALNFLPHDVLPLYPKAAWAKEVASLHWNILLPFFGGSGPMGFYVSFLFIALSFIVGAALAAAALFKREWRQFSATALLAVSLLYAGVFAEEYFFGRLNGSAPVVFREALTYIDTSDITSVITHNDIGAFELWQRGKYASRFYAAPQYEEAHRGIFAEHSGHYLVVGIPRWSDGSFYRKFFATCDIEFVTSSGVIAAHVYYCPDSDPLATQ